ncbi:glutaredoxin [Brucella ceti TE28753-12]|nr:glutaredoxin [Brucella ceti TE28753-12]
MNVTVYSKPACVQCTATTRALDRQGIDYKVIDISADANAFDLVQAWAIARCRWWLPVKIIGRVFGRI